MARRRKAELIDARELSPSVRSLLFRTVDGSAVGHAAGQYLDLIVPTVRGLPFKRSYSIASPPDRVHPDRFELAVTRVEGGPTSEALHGMAPGTRLEIEGPAGRFVRRPEERARPALFVATGTGLAPLRAMLAEEVPLPSGPPLVLLFGCRTSQDLLWGDELHDWSRAHARFKLHVTLSRFPPPEWRGLVGHVQRHADGLARSMPDAHAYVCGLSTMVDDVVDVLAREPSFARDRIHFETYD